MNKNTIVQRNSDLISTDLDGDTVMMDVESGKYFSLNNVGAYIWEILEYPLTIQSVIESVSAVYDVTEGEQVEQELDAFLTDLLKNGLILEVPN